MEVAMETGTLKDLNVKPGDVVECVEARTDSYTVGKRYLADDEGNIWNNLDWVDHTPQSKFRIISRAAQPIPDLTAITTPFGLLDASTQEALRAHGGPYEWFWLGKWNDCEYEPIDWDDDYTYRVKAEPTIEAVTEEFVIWDDGSICDDQTPAATPVRVTFNRINGVIDLASYKVEPR